jgi:hypothetical protein
MNPIKRFARYTRGKFGTEFIPSSRVTMHRDIRQMPPEKLEEFFDGLPTDFDAAARQRVADEADYVIHHGTVRMRMHWAYFIPPLAVMALSVVLLALSIAGLPDLISSHLGLSLAPIERPKPAHGASYGSYDPLGMWLLAALVVGYFVTQTWQETNQAGDPRSYEIKGAGPLAVVVIIIVTAVYYGHRSLNAAGASVSLALFAVGLAMGLGRAIVRHFEHLSFSVQGGFEVAYRTYNFLKSGGREVDRTGFGSGFFRRQVTGGPLDKLTDVQTPDQPWWHFIGILDYSNITLDTAGEIPNPTIRKMPRPDEIRALVLLIREHFAYDARMDREEAEQEAIELAAQANELAVRTTAAVEKLVEQTQPRGPRWRRRQS